MISIFDSKIRKAILKSDPKLALTLIMDFKEIIQTFNQQIVFNSFLKLYSTSSVIRDVDKLFFPTHVPQNLVQRKSTNQIIDYTLNIHKDSKILVILPLLATQSAGIKSLHILVTNLESLGFKIDKLFYSNEFDSSFIFNEFYKKYKLVIVPEIISHLPFKPINTIVYKGNLSSRFPSLKMGQFLINANDCLVYNHFSSLSLPGEKTLTLSHINFDIFKPIPEKILGGRAIYLGKFEAEIDHKKKLYELANEFQTSIIFTRNWPDNNDLSFIFQQLDLLVTLDPISSLNLEFALTGGPVFFHPECLSINQKHLIQSHFQNNKNFRFSSTDLARLTYFENSQIHETIKKVSIENDFRDFNQFVIDVRNIIGA